MCMGFGEKKTENLNRYVQKGVNLSKLENTSYGSWPVDLLDYHNIHAKFHQMIFASQTSVSRNKIAIIIIMTKTQTSINLLTVRLTKTNRHISAKHTQQ